MKKKLIAILFSSVFVLTSCGNNTDVKQEVTEKEELSEESEGGGESKLSIDWASYEELMSSDESKDFQEFLTVLNNEDSFTCFNWGDDEYYFDGYLQSIESDDEPDIEGIALVDLDNQNGKELILNIYEGGGNYLILTRDNGKFYGTSLGCRLFENLQKDGRYIAAGGAGSGNIYSMKIDSTGVEEKLLGQYEGKEQDDGSVQTILESDGTTEVIDDFEIWLNETFNEPAQWVSVTEDSNVDKNQASANAIDEDDFNDFVEVSFKHKDYPSTEDGKPDYSGIYCLDTYSTTYGCCNLIKQEDGYYYCYLYEYRCFIYETKAKYKSDNVLEIVDDEISGTIKVNDYDVDVSFVESNGNKVDISYTDIKYEYSDISQYTGTYTYKKDDGSEVTIIVGYDENRSPVITVEDGNETVEFTYDPSDRKIFILEDYQYGEILYASIEAEVWGPESELLSFTQGYKGDKYVVIRFEGNTPYVYFKTYNPVVMH